MINQKSEKILEEAKRNIDRERTCEKNLDIGYFPLYEQGKEELYLAALREICEMDDIEIVEHNFWAYPSEHAFEGKIIVKTIEEEQVFKNVKERIYNYIYPDKNEGRALKKIKERLAENPEFGQPTYFDEPEIVIGYEKHNFYETEGDKIRFDSDENYIPMPKGIKYSQKFLNWLNDHVIIAEDPEWREYRRRKHQEENSCGCWG